MTPRCAEKSFAVWTRAMSTPPIEPSRFERRIRKPAEGAWCHIRRLLAICLLPICAGGASLVATAAAYSFPNRGAIAAGRFLYGHGPRSWRGSRHAVAFLRSEEH